ncbi:hypothetical protein GCM10009557_71620 [Virgisporangium ochraceum]|uniref:Uncharacterized protein n=1 Tax=Virgisporangium ochraceum TaxID=65505 RepID=A0A8J4EAR1_9ACTN|nr:hypothetical protein Voc01_025950 [Virgisporangium ochraceum]
MAATLRTVTDAVTRWRQFERTVVERGLGRGLGYAPRQLRYARSVEHRHGADVSHLLPADYRAFVAEVGYPVLGFGYYDREGFSFLPPEAMESRSVDLPGPDDEWPEATEGGPTRCLFALFAAWDLSEIEGYAFGPADGADRAGGPAVWLVENGMAREVAHATFTEWLAGELTRQETRLADVSPEWDDDPHRLVDYSVDGGYDQKPYTAGDLDLVWVERQEGSPYSYGLVDRAGTWLIPLGKRFRSVRPFRDGIAEVILNDPTTSYAGPWSRIRTDGSVVG